MIEYTIFYEDNIVRLLPINLLKEPIVGIACTVCYCTIPYCTVLIVMYCTTVMYCTELYCTILYY